MNQTLTGEDATIAELSGRKVLVDALNVFWLLSSTIVAVGALPLAPAAFQRFLQKGAGRGKLRLVKRGNDDEQKKGLLQRFWDITVPHAFFSHFYLVGFLVTLTLIQHTLFPNHFAVDLGRPTAVLNAKGKLPFGEGTDHVFLLALMLIHVARRLYESTLIERHGPDSRLHIAGYIYGLCYYVAAPLTLYVHRSEVVRSVWGLLSVHQGVGALLFIFANIKQHQLGRILAGLRHRAGTFDRIPAYRIPRGDWFEWVTCPHYLAEILLYVGLVIVSGGKDLTIWLMFLWVVANLAYAAKRAKRWYVAKFEDYPKERKALIPMLF